MEQQMVSVSFQAILSTLLRDSAPRGKSGSTLSIHTQKRNFVHIKAQQGLFKQLGLVLPLGLKPNLPFLSWAPTFPPLSHGFPILHLHPS
jgi:hypothetical protein